MTTTTQNDNRAKFLNLRKQGISVADARNQTYGPPPVVADKTPQVTPTTPVTPTAPVAPVTPTQPAPMTQAPVDPTTGLSAPISPAVQPAPVTPITPVQAEVKAQEPVKKIASAVTPKTEAPIDYTQAKGREQDIINNLNTFKAQNMTPEQIMKASDYQNAAPEKRALIEPYLKQQVPTASAMYNNIVAKADIPDEQKTTLPYKIAQNRYTKASSFSTMTPAQLANEMNNSRFIQGSQAYEDVKAMNPKLVQDTENLRIVNGKKQNVFTYINNPDGTSTKVNNLENTFAEEYMDNFGDVIKKMFTVQTPEEIRAIIYTDDVKQAQDKASEIELTMNELEKQMDNVDDDVDKELAGSGATGSRIALEKASRKDKLGKEYNSQLKNYTTYANKANNLITQNTTVYTTQQQQQQAQNAAMLPFLTEQYKTQQEKIKAEQALNDPATQIKATMDEFAKLGIVAQGDLTSKLAEFKASGKTLPEYITGLRSQFMSKPEYKKIQELQAGQLSDAQKLQATQAFQTQSDIRNFAQQKELALLNKDLTRQQFLFELENDPEKKAKALELEQKLNSNKSLFDVLGKNVGTYEGNRGYDLAGALGDPLPAGGNWTVKSIDTAGEQVGSIFIGGKGSKPYGNTVVMEDENGNEIRYSHLQSIGVKPGDVLGFGDIVGTRGNTGNVKGANGETLTAEQLKAGRGAHVDIEIKSNGKLLSNADQVNFLKGLKAGGDQALTDKQFTQYNQTKTGFKSEPIVKSFEEALIAGGDIIQSLGSENGPGDVGAVFNFMKSLDPNSTVREGEFALAAKSAGVWESFKNIPANKLEGTILTDKQRKDFGKLAMKYIESKGKLYDTKYNDMIKVLENQGVPKSYYPTRMTDYINQYKGTQEIPSNTAPAYTTEQYNILDSWYTQN